MRCWVLLLLLPMLLLLQLLSNNRLQPDLNLREPPSESAPVRPKLNLLPRTVKDPVNTVMHTERNASIFGTGKPRESSPANETKRMLSQTSENHEHSTDWRKPRCLGITSLYCQTSVRTHTRTDLICKW